MRLHHLALTSPDPEGIAGFYSNLFELTEVRRQSDSSGIRSIWFDLEGVVLMIERGAKGEGGWHGAWFDVPPGSGAAWEERLIRAGSPPTSRTQYTLYGLDPDGNRFGVSSFPEPLFAGSSAG